MSPLRAVGRCRVRTHASPKILKVQRPRADARQSLLLVSVIDHYSQMPLPGELKADLEARRLQGALTESMLRQQEFAAHQLGGQSAAASAAAALKP